jgi:lipopolysaccharide heptosyltransferase II
LKESAVSPSPWEQATNILCVRLDTIGDVLMTTPAIRAIKESRRGRRITLLTSSAGAAIAGLVPEIDRVMVYDAPWMKATSPRQASRPDMAMVESLHAEGFNAAVVFTAFSQNPLPSAFLCYLAEIPLRLAHCHENPYQLLTDWVPDPEPAQFVRHEVRRQLDLVAEIGCTTQNERLSAQAPSRAHLQVRQILRNMGIDRARPWVVVHPGATAPSRCYPPESFVLVTDQLVTQFGLPVVFTGSRTESELVDAIRRAMRAPSYSLAGQLDLAQLTALIEMAPLVITNNTGPAHMAAAVGTPVVDLYALTNPQHQPWQVPSRVLSHDVPCKFCYKSICPEGHHNCLRLVTPDQVVQASIELLGEKEHASCIH